jgi:hypothetical protein
MLETTEERLIRRAKEYNKELRGPAEIAVAAIELDICDRRGLKHEWAEIDDDIVENDIKPAWVAIINAAFKTK